MIRLYAPMTSRKRTQALHRIVRTRETYNFRRVPAFLGRREISVTLRILALRSCQKQNAQVDTEEHHVRRQGGRGCKTIDRSCKLVSSFLPDSRCLLCSLFSLPLL